MCEILYKGFHKDENGTEKIFVDDKWIKGEWVYGYYIRYGWTHQEKDYIVPLYASALYAKEVIPETVGQYTGLTDKNGKKIFVEDIVKDEQAQMLGKVVYVTAADGFDGMAGFMVDDIDDGLQNYNGFWHLVEVIGNIYDNPELMRRVDNE